jgi:hypothetical protein
VTAGLLFQQTEFIHAQEQQETQVEHERAQP